jgi:alpha,alpha-trehalase
VRSRCAPRSSDLNGEHLEPLRSAIFACRSEDPGAADGMVLLVRTNQSRLEIAEAVRTRLWRGRRQVGAQRRNIQVPNGYVAQIVPTEVAPDTPLRIEKVLSLHTARDAACASCEAEAGHDLGDAGGFAELLASHSEAWDHLWRRFEISFRDEDAQRGDRIARIIRLHTFHVLQTASLNAAYVGIDAGIPPRGWTGEAYRGHIMWDELFVFPFLTLRLPEVARNLLMYRYRRLPEARRAGRAAGFRGAMFPWQSGSNGREESQRLHLNPRSGRWITDHSHLQRHINATIAYNIYHYYQATRDTEFLSFYGAELLFEVARFWSSLARYNEEQDRFEILGVMGPDEYHEGYPGAASSGLNNNAFTNVMAVWVLGRALELLEVLPEDAQEHLRRKLSLDDAEVGRWRRITRRMKIPFLGERGEIISQFEGYEGLEELDWDGYRRKYDNVQRLDRILESEGDTPNRYKVSKQADVLMLFYLLTSDELAEIFGDLGYPFSGETIPKNIDYYLARTSHGSTLSWMVHAWILARGDRERSWKLFNEALRSDVADIQGGTTPEGIHLGAMAGTVDQIQRGYTGIVPRRDTLWFEPCLPQELEELRLRIRYRGYLLEVVIDQERLRVRALRAKEHPITVGHRGETIKLDGRSTCEFSLAGRRVDTRAPR